MAIRIIEEIGEKRILIASLDGVGKTYLNQGHLTTAQTYLAKALRNAIEAKLFPQALDSLASLGHLKAKLGRMHLALGVLSFVIDHPACPEHARLAAKGDFDLLKADMPNHQISTAIQRAQDFSLEGILDILEISALENR